MIDRKFVATVLAAGLVFAASATPALAQDEAGAVEARTPIAGTAADYGQMPAYELVEVSPSGDRLAYVTVAGEERGLLIVEQATGQLLGGARLGAAKLRDIRWIDDDHILTVITATERGNISLSAAEVAHAQIYSIPNRRLSMVLQGTPETLPYVLNHYIRRPGGQPTLYVEAIATRRGVMDGYKVFRIDTATGRGREFYDWERRSPSYVAAPDGQFLAQAQYYSENGRWVLVLRRGSQWVEAWSTNTLLDQPYLAGVGTEPTKVVVHAARDGQAARFHQVDVMTGEWSGLPFQRDPDGLIRHPATGLVIGAVYSQGDEREYEFTDSAVDRSLRSARAAFRGRNPVVVSYSDDLRQIVVRTWGLTDAGSYHLVDLDAGTARMVGEAYPTVANVGEVRPIRYAAADGMEISGYLTLPPGVTDPSNLPLVVLPHGGPASRDTLSFDWWAQALAARGYAVLQPNFRGSDGLGQAHLEAGYGEWGGKMQSDLSDGVRWLASEGIVDPQRVCIVGASYGGYAALAGPTLDQGVYRCAVSVNGVSDLRAMVAWSAQRTGARNSPTVRYWNRFMGAERVGDRTLDARSPRQQAARADAPILLLHGRDDTVVPYDQSRVMAAALRDAGKPYELIRLDGEDHWLSRGDSRQRMLAETIRFLEAHNPPVSAP